MSAGFPRAVMFNVSVLFSSVTATTGTADGKYGLSGTDSYKRLITNGSVQQYKRIAQTLV